MYSYIDVTHMGQTQRIIILRTGDNSITQFPLTDDSPNKPAYDAWLAEGNAPEEWQPES
tara:strand:- start:2044 stop:2220 length:177 start_codon:yes stop_codon:yes gene_type:complete